MQVFVNYICKFLTEGKYVFLKNACFQIALQNRLHQFTFLAASDEWYFFTLSPVLKGNLLPWTFSMPGASIGMSYVGNEEKCVIWWVVQMKSVKIASVIFVFLMALFHVLKIFPHSYYLRMKSLLSKICFKAILKYL